jgi:hypothetical protein
MSPELDNKLVMRYPEIFKNRYGDMRTTAMCWGFDCGDGWYNLLDTACGLIQHHINWHNKTAAPEDQIPQLVAEQVKEKFGGLRFYTMGGDEYTRGIIALAEALSTRTCEQCGSPGKLRGRGWIYTSCDEHSKE